MSSKPRKPAQSQKLRKATAEIAQKLKSKNIPFYRYYIHSGKLEKYPIRPGKLATAAPRILQQVRRHLNVNPRLALTYGETHVRPFITITTGKRVPLSEVRRELMRLHRQLKRLGLIRIQTDLL